MSNTQNKLIPENAYLDEDAPYNYITTELLKSQGDIEIKKRNVDQVTKLGKFSIYNTTICDISENNEFHFCHQKILLEIKALFPKYTAVIKSKSAILHAEDRVVNRIFYKITVNNIRKQIWLEPHLLYLE